MDDYRPPPAYDLPPGGHGHPYSHPYNASSGQSNDANFDMNASSTYDIPGLQFAANSAQSVSFAPFAQQLWQQLKDSNLLSLASTSSTSNTVQPTLSNVEALGLNTSSTTVQAESREVNEIEEEEDFEPENYESRQFGSAENSADEMVRSESGEISEGEIVSDEGRDLNGKPQADWTARKVSAFSNAPNVPGSLLSISPKKAQLQPRGSPRSTFVGMENGRDRSQLAIPGLFRELDKETKEGIKGIFRQLSANGQSYSQLHHEARWKAAERRQMWALWNDAGLPVMPAEVAFYTALFESDDTIVDQYSGPEFLSAMQVVDRVSTTAQSGRAETVASSATRTEKTHIESSIQREAAVPVSSTATSVRIEKPSEHVASTSASISKQISAKLPTTASAPVEAASDRDAYVRRLQALKNKKPTVGSDVSTATKFAVSESPSLIAVKTAVPATPPKGPNQNKDEILKQKLEALRKATGKGSNSMSSLHTQDATAQPSQPSPSTAPQLQSFPHTGGTQPSLLTQHHKAPNLPYRPSSPPRQPAVTASSPQTPVTPIPGLFMNDSQPPFGQSYFYPPSQYPLTSSGPYNGYPAASTQYPSTTTGYTGYPTDHALSGQTSGFPSRPRPAIPIGHRPDQVQSSVQQEPVVINLNDSEDENGEEMDLEAETATQSKHPPITRTADDAISPSARASTEAQSTIAQLESTPNQQEQNKAQQQTQSKEQLERRIAELKAKFKADRAQQSLSKKQASAESSIAPTPVNAGQSSTNGVGLAVPATHPAKNATLPTPSEVIGPEQATPVSTNQQKKRPSEDADVSPEWRKKRRAELQSDLESRDQDLGSTAAKIAEMQRQLAQLQEEQLRQQQARETLAKELEELGVDTEGMSHEEMQATKDDIEAAQQQSLTMQDQGVPTNNGPAHTPAAPITTGPNSAPAQLAEEETVLLPGEVMVSVLVSTDNAWAAEVNEPSPSHEAEVQSTSEDDAMSIDTTDENDNVPVATIPPATEAAKKDDNRPWSSYKFDGIDVNDVYDPEDPLSSDDLDVEMNKPQAEKGPQAETSAQLISSAHTAATEVNQVKGEDEAYDPADLVLTAPAEPSHPPKEDSPIIQDTENADVAILATQEATERWLSALEQPETSAASAADMPKPEPRPYVPYESPLSMFKAYRFHPEYSQKVSGFRSLTYSHAIEPFTEFCATELNGGVCNDTTCHFQHFGKGVVELTGDKVLVQLGTDNPGKTEEQQKLWNTGLKELIKDLRTRNVKDSETVARNIAEYRRKFMEEQGEAFSLLKL